MKHLLRWWRGVPIIISPPHVAVLQLEQSRARFLGLSLHEAAAGLHRISHPLQNHKHREQGMDHPGVVAPLPEMTFASPPTSPILIIAGASPQSIASPPREYADKTSDLGTSSGEASS